MARLSLILFCISVSLLVSSSSSARLFNAPPDVVTGFQVLGPDNPRLIQEYRNREAEYGVTVDLYTFFLNCGMHKPDYSLNDEDFNVFRDAAASGKQVQLHFECQKDQPNEWPKIFRNWNDDTSRNWRNLFDSIYNAFRQAGKFPTFYFRPFQEFNNPVTGYPWVVEQGWNTPISGCYLQTIFSWSTCNSGYYSNSEDINVIRSELRTVFSRFRKVLNEAASAAGAPTPHFVSCIDGNTLWDDQSSWGKIAADLAEVSAGGADYLAIDGYVAKPDSKGYRQSKVIFVDGFNGMLNAQNALAGYKRSITEYGVDEGHPNRKGEICEAMRMPGLSMVVYWDSEGAGGQYKLTRDAANANCWPNGGRPELPPGNGLLREYWTGANFDNWKARDTGNIDFTWTGNDDNPVFAGGVLFPSKWFSARFTGQVRATVAGDYRFQTISDDGVRLWVNNQLLIDNWTGHLPTTDTSGPIRLEAGQKYPIKLEYFQADMGATIKLLWNKPGKSTFTIIHTNALFN